MNTVDLPPLKATLHTQLPVANQLGEGVIWHHSTRTLWWTDIEACKLYSYSLDREFLQEWSVPERIGSFGFTSKPDLLVVAFASGFALYNYSNGDIQWLAHPEQQRPANRLNDGRVDRQGRFWAGGMVEHREREQNSQGAGLYCLVGDCRVQQHLDGIRISNGLCWSPEADILYHADSPRRVITAYAFNATEGSLGAPRLFATTPEGIHPDGATIDSAGQLWSAQWGGSRVVCYDRQGQIRGVLTVPVSQVSCVAFAGPQLNLLCITSARTGLSEEQLLVEPDAGDLFIYEVDAHGLPETGFVLA
ncbi:MAG: SMP-30/gluconolactonase/LRE family protein [Pseudomonadales bacterium]|nr:SMP-30/gluconolactonase/LRE family protein [Pseudomonadales bacterium]